MSVKRAVDSRTMSRDGFCRLLVKIARSAGSKEPVDYSEDLLKYLKDTPLHEIGVKYDIKTTRGGDSRTVETLDLEIPVEFRTKDMAGNYVVRLGFNQLADEMKFNIRETKK